MNNILFVVTGPSGSGKTTIMRELMDNELLSFTTRPMREGETNGVDYQFITKKEFDSLKAEGLLVEETEYDGNYYGLTLQQLVGKTNQGHAFFICDNNGFNQIKEKYNNVVSIFLYADEVDCADNMFARGDTFPKVESRLRTYDEEIANRGQYDYVIENIRGNLTLTKHIVGTIIASEMLRFQS
jgi:guanylate kinase